MQHEPYGWVAPIICTNCRVFHVADLTILQIPLYLEGPIETVTNGIDVYLRASLQQALCICATVYTIDFHFTSEHNLGVWPLQTVI
eukprot:73750-Prorocentrum_minimum.AAC.3